MPGSAIDDVVVRLEVLVVADAAVRVGQYQMGGGVDGGQPAEEGIICSGGVFLGSPVPSTVKRVGNNQLSAVEVGTEHEGNILHPADDGSCLWGNLSRKRFFLLDQIKLNFNF